VDWTFCAAAALAVMLLGLSKSGLSGLGAGAAPILAPAARFYTA
jgi:hypothetical protein